METGLVGKSTMVELEAPKRPLYPPSLGNPRDDPLFVTRRQMVAPLSPREMEWRSLQPLLQIHGYMLRARYHPDWTPSPHIDLNIYDPEDYPRGCFFVRHSLTLSVMSYS
jgi:hypothetical protein